MQPADYVVSAVADDPVAALRKVVWAAEYAAFDAVCVKSMECPTCLFVFFHFHFPFDGRPWQWWLGFASSANAVWLRLVLPYWLGFAE